jgi:hypothetical protein
MHKQGRLRPSKGAALARRKGFPNLPRFACAYLRCAPPFPFRRWLRCKGGETPPLHLATPPSPGGVRHEVHATHGMKSNGPKVTRQCRISARTEYLLLEPRVDWFTFQSQNFEDAFMSET